MVNRSELVPTAFKELPDITGIRIYTFVTNTKYKKRDDLLVVVFDKGTIAAGVYTSSLCPSAPVEWCKESVNYNKIRGLVVNSGNANAFTGKRGVQTVNNMATGLAKNIGCNIEGIAVASTGVIGEFLNESMILDAIETIDLRMPTSSWVDAAKSIMTTDTFSKLAFKLCKIDNCEIIINGIAKGSGMIAPDMATMLSFIFTNANISHSLLQEILKETTNISFNAITVDGDTSTSDTFLAFSSNKAKHRLIEDINDPKICEFIKSFKEVAINLAKQIVKDGEGARKFVTIELEGAISNNSARIIAKSIANSPLFKTAIFGEDPNWGRIVMAIGKAGEPASRDKVKIWIGNNLVASDGVVVANYNEEVVADYMKNKNINIKINVGIGEGYDKIWTCDLSHQYITINADYRS
jgi:glutamate N-acetyltransferase/amino-acid N-acetyltransferase